MAVTSVTSSPNAQAQQAALALNQAFALTDFVQDATRKHNWRTFMQQGLPNNKSEAWRYSPLRRLLDLPPFAWTAGTAPDDDVLTLPGCHLLWCDGVFDSQASTPMDALPSGVSLSWQDAWQEKDDQDPFVAANGAINHQAWCIQVAKNTLVEQPLYLHFVSTCASWSAHQGRVEIAAHGQIKVIAVSHFAQEGALQTSRVHYEVGENATLKLLHWSSSDLADARWLNHDRVTLQRFAQLQAFAFLGGRGLMRHHLDVILAEEGGESSVNSLVLGQGKASLDSRTFTHHASPHCQSRQMHKLLLTDESQGIFDGLILVDPVAQKIDGQMENRNLLLSPKAKVDTKPQLEIYADDVKCSHGVTTGQLDESARFYLQARGLNNQQARNLLLKAFALDAVPQWVREGEDAFWLNLMLQRLAQL